MMINPSPLHIRELGTVPYTEAWALQKELAQQRAANLIPDTLLLLEHPPTYTLGSAGKLENLLMSEAELAAANIALHWVDRGGDVTYHGPGQWVGYPILQLPRRIGGLHADVVQYVRQLEEVLIVALADFGISGQRIAGLTGVWVENPDGEMAKIAAIGVKVTAKAVTQHGFALNVQPDMAHFRGIIPCGIADKPVTSLAELGYAVGMAQMKVALVESFRRLWRDMGAPT